MKNSAELRIVLVGSGNVATHLGSALVKAGIKISQVWSRKISNAKKLAGGLKAKAIADLSKIDPSAALIIIAVKDDAIESVAKKIKVNDAIVVHTAGSVPAAVLEKFPQYGVLYPLQTFSKNTKVDFSTVPLCIEANDTVTLFSLTAVAEKISRSIYQLDSKQRAAAHLAAVFASNFTNHLYAVSEKILEENHLPFDLLQPLILETAKKVQHVSPADAQTGPALRNDVHVIEKHLALLKKHTGLKKIYTLLSENIRSKK